MTKMLGIGTVLKCSTAGTSTFGVTIGQVRGITRSGISIGSIETYTLDDAPNMTFAPGWIDGGELEIVTAYDPATAALGHAALNSIATGRITGKFALIHAVTTINEQFDGFVTGIERPIEIDGMVEQTWTVKVTGVTALTT